MAEMIPPLPAPLSLGWSLPPLLLSRFSLVFRNSKFSDGLAQSRLRFVGDLENLFGMTGPLEETLDKLEEVGKTVW